MTLVTGRSDLVNFAVCLNSLRRTHPGGWSVAMVMLGVVVSVTVSQSGINRTYPGTRDDDV